MLEASNAALAEAVASNDRQLGVEFLVDWNRDGNYDHPYSDLSTLVISADTDRTLTGSLPPATSLVEGFSAGELKLTLAGRRSPEELAASELLAPYRADSPLYGIQRISVPVRYSIVVQTSGGPVTLRQFTGRTRSFDVRASARDVRVACLDAAEQLRGPVTLPVWAHWYGTGTQYLINSQWAVDYVLRQNGFYQSPPAHTAATVSATYHGAPIAEIGRLDVDYLLVNGLGQSVDAYTDGPFGTAGNAVDNQNHYAWYVPDGGYLDQDNGNVYGLSGWFQMTPSSSTSELQYNFTTWGDVIRLGLYSDGRIGVYLYNNNTWWVGFQATDPLPTDSSWHYVAADVQFRPGRLPRIRLNVDGVVEFREFSDAYPALSAEHDEYLNTIDLYRPFQCIQAWCGSDADRQQWPHDGWSQPMPEPFEPTAVLTKGLNTLGHLPDIINGPSWDVLKEIVGAEYGSLYCDEYGRPTFLNRVESKRARETVDRTLGENVLLDVGITDQSDDTYNVITATMKVGYLINAERLAWSAPNPDRLVFPPGDSTMLIDDLTGVMWLNESVPYSTDPAWDTSWPMRGFYPIDASTGDYASNVSVRGEVLSQRSFHVHVTNGNTFDVALTDVVASENRQPQPRLRLSGYPIRFEDQHRFEVRDEASTLLYQPRPFEIESSDWRQTESAMTTLANELLTELATPVPVVGEVPVVGDPRLQMQDSLLLQNPHGHGTRIPAMVSGVRRRFTDGKLSDRLILRLSEPSRIWVLGSSRYSILGQSTIL